jgi:hypothetical protein
MDAFVSWVCAVTLFAVVSLLFGPDSRDRRRASDIHGTWVGLTA